MASDLKVERLENDDSSEFYSFMAVGKKTEKLNRPYSYSREDLREFIKNPVANYLQLQQSSDELSLSSGIYFRMTQYLSTMLTYDHWIFPISTTAIYEDIDLFWKEFELSAKRLNKYNIKYNCGWWTEKLIKHGEIYLYKIDDGTNIVFNEFPTSVCRIAQEVNGVLRFEIDLNKISSDDIKEYPQEIKIAWNKDPKRKDKKAQRNLNKNRSTILNNNGDWYLVSNKGFAFSAQYMQQHGYPFLTSVFDDIIRVLNAKDDAENNMKANNFKLIHNKIAIDDKTRKPVVDKDTAQTYHNETKKQVPEGVGVATNLFEVNAITLQNKETSKISLTQDAQADLWSSSGFSRGLFSTEKATGEGIKRSTVTDEMMMFPFLRMYENYFNEEIKNNFNRQISWAIHFINSTHQNIKELRKDARENMAFGGSRFMFIATCEETPFEFIMRSKMENSLNIDVFLPPKLTSHTLSGNDVGNQTVEESGKELSEAGELTRENQ